MTIPPFGSPPGTPAPGQADQPESPQPRMVPVQSPSVAPTVTFVIMGVTIFVYLLQELNRSGIFQAPFLALTSLVFGANNLQALLNNGWGNDLLVLLGGKITGLILTGQYWRLLTPALLHGSLLHIGANMYSLYILGPRMERFYGHSRFLALYVLTAMGGNVLSFLLSPGVSIGASTAIFGLIAAEGVFAFMHRHVFGPQARAMLNNIIFLILLNLFIGFSSQVIDNWGHLGGLFTGIIFAWLAGPQLEVAYNYSGYELVDRRSSAVFWTVSIVLFIMLFGVVLLRAQIP